MSANVEAMVREGINAFKAGRKDEARALLLKATELDQFNEQAWLWLSGLMDTPEDQRTCLENVLAINPNNERASQGLSYLTGQTPAGNVSPFSASSAPPSSAPPSAPSPMDLSAPTSVEWGAPEPAPAWSQPPAAPREPSPAVLDDWVANLNLTSNDSNDDSGFSFDPSAAVSVPSTSPFGDFGLDDDQFPADGPFSSSLPANPDPLDDPLLETAAPMPARKTPPPARQPAERRRRSSAPRGDNSLLYSLESTREAEELDAEQGGMFGYIPSEIPPTRLPGTHERTPTLLVAGMVLLIALNVGAGVLVALNLLT